MQAEFLSGFEGNVLGMVVSPFEGSQDCIIVRTSRGLSVGILLTEDTKDIWKLFKEIPLMDTASSVTFNPHSRTLLLPMLVRLSYSDKNGVYNLNISENGVEQKQTLVKNHLDISEMSYNEEGDRLALIGGDKFCRILSYKSESLSECDSMASDAVAEGSYEQCYVPLTSEGQCVAWHKTRTNYLVVAEMAGLVRLITCITDGDKDTFVCEYVVNIGLRIPVPLYDMDLIFSPDTTSHDFIVACPSGLFMFALDKPLTSLERLNIGSHGAGGNVLVKMSHSWGHGSLLATVFRNGQLVVTDLGGTKVIKCGVKDCVAICWQKSSPSLLVASMSSLMSIRFSG